MSREIIFTNARVVTRHEVFPGTVTLAGGRIVAVDPGTSRLPSAEDLDGDYLLPGLVELHTDNMERHFMPRPGVDWPAKVAATAHDAQVAAAGITTVLDAIAVGDIYNRSGRVRHLDHMIAAIRWGQTEGQFRADHRLHLRCELCCENVLDMFGRFTDEPLVRLVSLMDHTPGQRQFVSIDKYRTYYQGKYGFTDAEMAAFIDRQVAAQKRFGTKHRAWLVEECRARGFVLASHDDATAAQVEEAVDAGMTISEFPTTIEAAEVARARGLDILMGAPNLVLGGSHSGNVSASDLAECGLLDILSSDYVPSSLLHGAFLLADRGIDLADAVAKVSARPAGLVGLSDRGEIAAGKRADLVRVRVAEGNPFVADVWREGRRIA